MGAPARDQRGSRSRASPRRTATPVPSRGAESLEPSVSPLDAPPRETVAAWSSIDGLVHAFFGRNGGQSGEPWDSLNLSESVGDSPAAVGRNWTRVARSIGTLEVARMTQVHGNQVAEVAKHRLYPGECDGLMTRETGIALSVMTADCVPILMVAPAHRAVMALHAGWRGTVAGIAASGLQSARSSFGIDAAEWQVALGPSIGGCCYEVSSEIADDLQQRWGTMPEAWQPSGRRGQLDLRRANEQILIRSGVPHEAVSFIGPCTACAHRQYFSHRQSGGVTGRQASLIGFRR